MSELRLLVLFCVCFGVTSFRVGEKRSWHWRRHETVTRERRAREQESACNKRCWSGPLWDDQWATHVLNDGLAHGPSGDAVTEAAESANSCGAGWSEKDKRKVHVEDARTANDSDVETSPEVNQGIRPSNSTFGGPSLIDARKEVTVDAFLGGAEGLHWRNFRLSDRHRWSSRRVFFLFLKIGDETHSESKSVDVLDAVCCLAKKEHLAAVAQLSSWTDAQLQFGAGAGEDVF